jgi:transcriptional regulator with XRE-family HTH domain
MIKNQKQAAIVKKEISGIVDLLADMDKISSEQKLDLKQQLQYAVLKSRVEELNAEIDEYDHLTSNNLPLLEITTNDLQKAIISFRIASGLTQKEIADKLEIQEQQIQRYEQNDYLTASFERIIQILNVLEVEVILRKEFSKETKVIDFSRFCIPESYKNNLMDKVRDVANRNQLLKVG